MEVEILDKVEIAQEVKFIVEEREVSTMIVNGVPQQSIKIPQVIIRCSSCNNDLLAFNPGIELVDIYRELGEGTPENMLPTHCPHCGVKLSCDKRVVEEVIL